MIDLETLALCFALRDAGLDVNYPQTKEAIANLAERGYEIKRTERQA